MKSTLQRESSTAARSRGFTLVELLVVISIIGVLAALILSGVGAANKKVKLSRADTELQELVAAIEDYKAKLGFYPPDGSDPATPPLYYELVGVYGPSGGPYTSTDGRETIADATILANFGFRAFANTAPTQAEARNFLPALNPKKMIQISASPDVELLRTTVTGAGGASLAWNYVSRNPVHNPKTYDLWLDIVIGNTTNRVSNWKNRR